MSSRSRLPVGLLAAGMLLVLSQAALGQPACEVKGKWISGAESTLELEVKDGTLSGNFTRKGDKPTPLIGKISPSTDGRCPLSFSVSWPAQGPYKATITSYTGRFEMYAGKPRIRLIFLLVLPEEKSSYASVSVSLTIFAKNKEDLAIVKGDV
jgi:Avidin family